MIEIDNGVPIPKKGREVGSKNRVSPERQALLEEARKLHANGVAKINAAYGLEVRTKLGIEPSTFAKLI